MLDAVLERKSTADLVSSILDKSKRYEKQKVGGHVSEGASKGGCTAVGSWQRGAQLPCVAPPTPLPPPQPNLQYYLKRCGLRRVYYLIEGDPDLMPTGGLSAGREGVARYGCRCQPRTPAPSSPAPASPTGCRAAAEDGAHGWCQDRGSRRYYCAAHGGWVGGMGWVGVAAVKGCNMLGLPLRCTPCAPAPLHPLRPCPSRAPSPSSAPVPPPDHHTTFRLYQRLTCHLQDAYRDTTGSGGTGAGACTCVAGPCVVESLCGPGHTGLGGLIRRQRNTIKGGMGVRNGPALRRSAASCRRCSMRCPPAQQPRTRPCPPPVPQQASCPRTPPGRRAARPTPRAPPRCTTCGA